MAHPRKESHAGVTPHGRTNRATGTHFSPQPAAITPHRLKINAVSSPPEGPYSDLYSTNLAVLVGQGREKFALLPKLVDRSRPSPQATSAAAETSPDQVTSSETVAPTPATAVTTQKSGRGVAYPRHGEKKRTSQAHHQPPPDQCSPVNHQACLILVDMTSRRSHPSVALSREENGGKVALLASAN